MQCSIEQRCQRPVQVKLRTLTRETLIVACLPDVLVGGSSVMLIPKSRAHSCSRYVVRASSTNLSIALATASMTYCASAVAI
jgi:hypothetical protein